MAAPSPDAPPATSAFIPSICIAADASPGVRCGVLEAFSVSTSLPPKLARIFTLLAVRVRNLNVAEYSHTRDRRARLVETTFLPRLAVTVTVPEQPWEGETVVRAQQRPRGPERVRRAAVAARAQREPELARRRSAAR